ncbi:toll/interleukin-1 receptor domain-containing protein [Idiomarina sp.]|uniref:toll/interleukin-1 receptor domain-containing protein n=1 Tax=Idiomarina sp. TaxID=1874361 RepID=UPI003A92A95D
MKRRIKVFVSYARSNKTGKQQFMAMLSDYAGADARFEFEFWQDSQISIGSDWNESIHTAMAHCDVGLLLLSPAFLQSQYITEKELPVLVQKPLLFPVALAPIDFKRHDLKGLQAKQIFRLDAKGLEQPRAFSELKSKRRQEFVMRLYEAMHDQLVEQLSDIKSSATKKNKD